MGAKITDDYLKALVHALAPFLSFIHSFICSSNKYILSPYPKSGIKSGTRDNIEKKTNVALVSLGLTRWVTDQKLVIFGKVQPVL